MTSPRGILNDDPEWMPPGEWCDGFGMPVYSSPYAPAYEELIGPGVAPEPYWRAPTFWLVGAEIHVNPAVMPQFKEYIDRLANGPITQAVIKF